MFDTLDAGLGWAAGHQVNLTSQGLLDRRRYQTRPDRYEYVLTELGRSLRPVVVALAAWGNSCPDPSQRSMILVDRNTGEEADPVIVDRTTGRPLDADDFAFAAGPAAGRSCASVTSTSRPGRSRASTGPDRPAGRRPGNRRDTIGG